MAEGPEGQASRAQDVPDERPLSRQDVQIQVATLHGQDNVPARAYGVIAGAKLGMRSAWYWPLSSRAMPMKIITQSRALTSTTA